MSRLYLSNPCAFFRYFRARRCGRSQRPAFPAPSSQERDNEFVEPGRKRVAGMRACARQIHLSSRRRPGPIRRGGNYLARWLSALRQQRPAVVMGPGLRRGDKSPHRPLGLDLPLRHDAIAAALLGLVERAVAAVDQIFHGLAELELADPDRHGDPWQRLAGGTARDLAVGARSAETLGGRRADVEVRTGKDRDQLFAAIAGRQIVFAHTVAQSLCNQAQHLVADTMAEPVVELLEVVDVDQERAERG